MASALVLIATPIVVWATRPDPNVGTLPRAFGEADAIEPPSPLPEAEPVADPAEAIPATNLVVRSARLEDYRPSPTGPRPVSLRIEAIGVRAPIIPVGVEERASAVEVPTDVDTVGWYRFGPSPGTSGSSVLLGHVDSWQQGPGAFFRLRELRPGDVVNVAFANGSRSSFRIVARRSYPKAELPPGLFDRTGRPMLALVTCGGSFDRATRSYADNVVVVAVPLD